MAIIEVPLVPIPTTPAGTATPADTAENSHLPARAGPEALATGRRATAILFAGIGRLWWLNGALQVRGLARMILVALGMAQAVALLEMSVRTLGTQGSTELMRRNHRMFNRVNGIQLVAIAAAAAACFVTNSPKWMLPLVAIIVGLHFLPFAAAFQ